MKAFGLILAGCLFIFSLSAQDQKAGRELIQDNHFRHGFILWEPKPGRHARYGELKGFDSKTKPAWGLSQWSSKFPLNPDSLRRNEDGSLVFSNAAKTVILGAKGTEKTDISLAANSAVEYGARAKMKGEPWIHLLLEQEFDPPAPLEKLSAANLHVAARLLRSRNLHHDDYSPDVHAAQFQIYFTVQNRNRQSPGFGDLVWFGIPIYDNRDRFVKEVKFQDFGGTEKFIFMPEGKTFTSASTHDGNWIVIEKNILPLMYEALETAWARGFLTGSKERSDYHIGGLNLGWELPGSFDVEMQLRDLSLKLAEK